MHISIITKTETETAEQYVVCGDQLYYTLMHMIVQCRMKKNSTDVSNVESILIHSRNSLAMIKKNM